MTCFRKFAKWPTCSKLRKMSLSASHTGNWKHEKFLKTADVASTGLLVAVLLDEDKAFGPLGLCDHFVDRHGRSRSSPSGAILASNGDA
jgi:hypothetical protein